MGESVLRNGDRICFLGDSITAADPGYTRLTAALLTALRPDLELEFLYAGISGNRVGDLLERLERSVLRHRPTVVTVSIGVNDVWHRYSHASGGTSDDAFPVAYRELCDRLEASGARAVLLTPTVIGEDEQVPANRDLARLVGVQRQVAAERHLPLADMNRVFWQAIAARRQTLARERWPLGPEGGTRFFTTDGVHMNSSGNALMAAVLLETLSPGAASGQR